MSVPGRFTSASVNMRIVLGFTLAVLAVHPAGADDKKVEKIDAAKLVGKWELRGQVVEFMKDGKLAVTIPGAGGSVKLNGTYKVEGNKLTTVVKAANGDAKTTVVVSKQTDTELAGIDNNGLEAKYVKVKQ